jgi:hypothetical protein
MRTPQENATDFAAAQSGLPLLHRQYWSSDGAVSTQSYAETHVPKGVMESRGKVIRLRRTIRSHSQHALIDRGLERLIKARLYPLNSQDDAALFGPSGSFGTLASKIRIAYAMGIIGPATRHDLTLINEIINIFAHSPSHLTLANKILKKKVMNMRMFHVAAAYASKPNGRMFKMTNLELTPRGS